MSRYRHFSRQVELWERVSEYGTLPRIQNEIGIQVLHECDARVDLGDAAQLSQRSATDTKLMAELRYWMSTMHVASIIGKIVS